MLAGGLQNKTKTLLKTSQDISQARKISTCKIIDHRPPLELKAYAVSCVENFLPTKSMKCFGTICVQKMIDSLKSILLITQVQITYLNHFQVRMVSLTFCILPQLMNY